MFYQGRVWGKGKAFRNSFGASKQAIARWGLFGLGFLDWSMVGVEDIPESGWVRGVY